MVKQDGTTSTELQRYWEPELVMVEKSEKLKRDGFKIDAAYDPITGKEKQRLS